MKTRQRGNILIGLIVGLVLGLGIALGVAVYVTKVPVPFLNKTQTGGAERDEAEALKNRDWNPNAALAGKGGPKPAPANPAAGGLLNAPDGPATPPVPVVVPPAAKLDTPAEPSARPTIRQPIVPAEVRAKPPSSDPLGDLARARSATEVARAAPASSPAPAGATDAEPFLYFVQAGAFRSQDDAESQRARLSLMGIQARVTEREQAGRTVFRVRAGPFETKGDADRLKERLDSNGLDSALVRVQR